MFGPQCTSKFVGFVIFLCIFVVVLSRFFYLSDMIKLDFFSVQISYLLILFSDVFFWENRWSIRTDQNLFGFFFDLS